MALDICNPCCSPRAFSKYLESWREATLRVLCQILTQLADGIAVTVTPTQASTATVTSVNDSNADQTLLAANANRVGLNIYNDSDQILYVKYGGVATTTDFTVPIGPGDFWSMDPVYTGVLHGIWAANSTGAAKITELT